MPERQRGVRSIGLCWGKRDVRRGQWQKLLWANVSPDFLTSRTCNRFAQPVLVESGKCCILFVRYRTYFYLLEVYSLGNFSVSDALIRSAEKKLASAREITTGRSYGNPFRF